MNFLARRESDNLIRIVIATFFFMSLQVIESPTTFLSQSFAALSAPTISSITPQNGYAEVAFNVNASATNYDYSIDGGLTWISRSPAGTWSPLSIYGLTNGTTYSIKIRARDASGPGAASSVQTVTPSTRSQFTSTQAYLQGKYTEIGIRGNGAFGSTTIPAGFHGKEASCLGFRVDRQKNGWGATIGSSAPFTNIDDGDYFCPGSQYEGWGLQVNGGTSLFNNDGSTGIAGSISNLITNSTEQKVDWTAAASTSGILVKQTSVVPNDGQSLHVDITLQNTSSSTINNIYYVRGFDPDDSTGDSTGTSTSYNSTNVITSRGGAGTSAEVRATFPSGAQILLRSTDSRARAAAGASLTCCTGSQAVPSTVWSATSPFNLAVGTPGVTGDLQVAVSMKIESLAAGASTTFRISYVLTAEDANSPSVTTNAATNVDTTTSATLNASVNPNGAATTVEFEYGTDPTLSTGTSLVSAGSLTGSSSQSASAGIINLTRGTTYYFRAKGTNSVGVSYGSILSFTPIGPPVTTISAASSIGETTTIINAQVNANGGATTTLLFIWSTSSTFASDTFTAAATPPTLSGNTLTSVSADLKSLTGAVTYYYKVTATNAAGTTTSDSISFTTTPAPTATTETATSVTSTGATLNGTANARGNPSTSLNFSYSQVADLSSGVSTVATTPSQATGSSNTPVSTVLTGLTTGTTYYYRLNISNINGSNSGQIRSFTPSAAPTVITDTATVSGTTATLKGFVNPNGAITSAVNFIYGTSSNLSTDTATVSITPNNLSGSSSQAISLVVNGLTPLTTYYYRAIATNAQGSGSGLIQSFTTPFADVTAPSETATASSSSFSKVDNILVTITFSESITGFTAADVTLGGTSGASYGKGTPTTINPYTYTILLSPSSASPGTLTISIGAATVLDYSGNANIASSTLTLTIKEVQATFTLTGTSGYYGTLIRMASSGGSGSGIVSYSATSGTASGCAISNTDSLTSTSAGTCVVVATKAGDSTYAPISDTKTITFNKALRTIAVSTSNSSSSLTYLHSVRLIGTPSAGTSDGVISFSAGVSNGCSLSIDSITAIDPSGTCVVTATISAGTNYDSATSTYLVVSILKASQAKLVVGQYDAFPGISTYPLNVYGGTGSGTVTRNLDSPGGAGCSLSGGMFITAVQIGTCSVTVVKSADNYYLTETATATIFWIEFKNSFVTQVQSVPTQIAMTGQVQVIKHSYETLTVTNFQTIGGSVITSASIGDVIRIVGTGFDSTDMMTVVHLGGIDLYLDSSIGGISSIGTSDPAANYIQLTIPSGTTTDYVLVESSKGTVSSASKLTIVTP